ncbi:VHS-domain-containing protein [Dendrothele bispora CBS 962.96]|uniref:VHS-domain-containing protein n=1 Tax=Dendrothele bispora (strain CBS 962.96) TaxID=1314807 RepID=A0A4S8M8G6_DENBC|nr:VHS-domain-containing protein [Dendrothele bispora CBS 962.96]
MLSSPSASNWLRISPLEVLISRACDPSLHEPNYAIHLEVAEYVNDKKANTPREAAMSIARLANNRNPHIAMLALALLDTLVQSCGYAFHLQISTKEFLNELVRRFPERPPPFPNAVMSRILELIHNWKEGICAESRWKDDLGNIRDMHRLLTFKGYRFRELPRREQNLTSSVSNLKTAEELEEEDREAQSAKLQELIRRGTPRDLAAAQELMKSLAGANPDAKPDYRTQALTELNKLESKVILLNEMLDNVDTERGERFVAGDAYDQVATILSAARPKLQKWIGEAEGGDTESLDTFLQINDQINTVLNRYEAFKKGDYAAAANPIPAELATGSAGAGSSAGLSLIDFDDAPSATNGSTNSGADDIMGLFGSSASMSTPAAKPNINQGYMNFGAGSPSPATTTNATTTYSPSPVMGGMGSNTMMGGAMQNPMNPMFRASSMSPPQGSGTPPGSIMLPGTPKPGTPGSSGMAGGMGGVGMGMGGMMNQQGGMGSMMGQQQHGFGMGMNNGMGGGMGMGMGPSNAMMQSQRPQSQSQPQSQQSSQSATGNAGRDPFADLAGLF